MSTKPTRKASNPHLGSDFDDFLREEGFYEEAQVTGALGSAPQRAMLATVSSRGQLTIPKRIRDALRLQLGAVVEFSVNAGGEVVLQQRHLIDRDKPRKDRFDVVRGQADLHWSTDGLMNLLRASE